jgi:hypothetical protein
MLKGVIQMCHLLDLLDLLDYSYIELTNLTNNVFTTTNINQCVVTYIF